MSSVFEKIEIMDLTNSGISKQQIDEFRNNRETKGKHLSNDTRWTSVVAEYSGAQQFNWIAIKDRSILEIGTGNLFTISRFGQKTLVTGAFLDHGESTYNESITKQETQDIHLRLLRNLNSRKFVTKEFDNGIISARSQSILKLGKSTEADFLNSISSRARNDLKKAKASGVSIDFGLIYLSEFYKLYVKRMQEFGTPPHSKHFFETIIKYFPNQAYVGVAKLGEKVVASSFGIVVDNQMFHLFANIEKGYRRENPGDLLLFEEIIRGLNQSVDEVWLGRSKSGSTIEFYKSKWNPNTLSTNEFCLFANGAFERVDQADSQELTARVFVSTPRSLFQFLGSRVRRFIP